MMHAPVKLTDGRRRVEQRGIALLRRNARWLLIVVLPTSLVALYYGVFAANQYESEAHILVRSTQTGGGSSAGLQALSLIGGASSAPSDSASVSDYLLSHDAIDALRRKSQLVERYRRPEADWLSSLTPADPTPERLLRYFRGHADIKLEQETGITSIKVRSFRPEDSFQLVNALLDLGEKRVNLLNRRAYESSLALARRQLAEAEQGVSQASGALTAFRQDRRNIDPVATGQAQIGVVSNLQASLAEARAQQAAIESSVSSSSPQALAINQRVRALQAQVGSEAGRLTGGSNAIAANVGGYQSLQLRQQFAAKRYDEAAASLQRAREQAEKQQLFIVRVVNPNLPVKALYPRSFKVIATVFTTLLLCYAIGWLIVAGVREHAA